MGRECNQAEQADAKWCHQTPMPPPERPTTRPPTPHLPRARRGQPLAADEARHVAADLVRQPVLRLGAARAAREQSVSSLINDNKCGRKVTGNKAAYRCSTPHLDACGHVLPHARRQPHPRVPLPHELEPPEGLRACGARRVFGIDWRQRAAHSAAGGDYSRGSSARGWGLTSCSEGGKGGSWSVPAAHSTPACPASCLPAMQLPGTSSAVHRLACRAQAPLDTACACTGRWASRCRRQARHAPPPPTCSMLVVPSGCTVSSTIRVKPLGYRSAGHATV